MVFHVFDVVFLFRWFFFSCGFSYVFLRLTWSTVSRFYLCCDVLCGSEAFVLRHTLMVFFLKSKDPSVDPSHRDQKKNLIPFRKSSTSTIPKNKLEKTKQKNKKSERARISKVIHLPPAPWWEADFYEIAPWKRQVLNKLPPFVLSLNQDLRVEAPGEHPA